MPYNINNNGDSTETFLMIEKIGGLMFTPSLHRLSPITKWKNAQQPTRGN